ncbi:MAG: hypothetical protein WD875_19615 [Pirellulales bacterium]
MLRPEVLQARLQTGVLRTEVLRSVQLVLQRRLLRPVRRPSRVAGTQVELLQQV